MIDDSSQIPLKRCTKCQESLPITSFPRNKGKKDGFSTQCKECARSRTKAYAETHKEQILEKSRAYYHAHKEQAHIRIQRYYQENKEHIDAQHKQYDETHREQERERQKRYREIYREEMRAYQQRYRETHKEQKRLMDRLYYEVHSEQIRERARHYHSTHKSQHYEWHKRYSASHRELMHESQKKYTKTEHGKMTRRVGKHRRRARELAVKGFHTAQQIRDQFLRQKGKCWYCRNKVKWGEHHIEHTFPLSRVIGTDIPANSIDYLVITCGPCNFKKGNKYPWEWPEGGRLF